MAVLKRIIGDNETLNLDFVRFKSGIQAIHTITLWDSVVADERIGQDQNLALV